MNARAQRKVTEETVEPWPRGISREPELSIGQLVERLKGEFPAITQSKVRFLEDKGLVVPARTLAGYRKYSRADIERLRYVLASQRDSYSPLDVIRDQLRALDAGHEVSQRRAAQVVASEGKVVSVGNRRAIPAADLADLTGCDLSAIERYVTLGLISSDIAGYFPARSVQVVLQIRELESMGVDARTLRSVRQGAERSADLIDQTVLSQTPRDRAVDRERQNARCLELGERFAHLHQEMLRVAISQLTDGGV